MRFRLKVTICMVWLLTLAYGIGGGLLIWLSFREAIDRERETAVTSYQMTMYTLELVNTAQMNDSDITNTLERLNRQTDWAAIRLQQGDKTQYADGVLTDQMRSLPVDEAHCSTQIWQAGGQWYLQVSGVLQVNGQQVLLDIAYDVSAPYLMRAQQLAVYRRVFLISIVVGGILCWVIAWFLTRPISELSAASRRFAKGELSHRVRRQSADEIGQLAGEFNAMAQKLEQNVLELQESMKQQERFMGSFAHELKTPMTAIIGYADLLRTQSLQPEEAMDAANYIFSEGKRLESLSLRLLELLVMQHQEPKLVKTEPGRLISNLVRNLRPVYAREKISLQCKCKPGVCLLEPDLFGSLLVNLLDNARKAMEHGGNIYVVSDWVDGMCRIRVLDNGRGMPPDTIGHLTEAFYRVDKSRSRAQGGVGLGLTLCQEIARLHNGTISFDSREGNGTCVTVLLGGAVQ